jgi:hypothetical protein
MTQLFGLSLLPLLGGFIFLRFFNLTKDRAYRYSGYKLLFYSAFWGLMGDLAAILLVNFSSELYQLVKPELSALEFPLKGINLSPYKPRTLLAFSLLATSWIPLNLFDVQLSGEQQKA